MAVEPAYIVDNSAWNRLKYPSIAARLKPLTDANLVATCGALEVEALYSARNWKTTKGYGLSDSPYLLILNRRRRIGSTHSPLSASYVLNLALRS